MSMILSEVPCGRCQRSRVRVGVTGDPTRRFRALGNLGKQKAANLR